MHFLYRVVLLVAGAETGFPVFVRSLSFVFSAGAKPFEENGKRFPILSAFSRAPFKITPSDDFRFLPQIKEHYTQTFAELLAFDGLDERDPEVQKAFTAKLKNISIRHQDTVMIMANAVLEVKNKYTREGTVKMPRFQWNIQVKKIARKKRVYVCVG